MTAVTFCPSVLAIPFKIEKADGLTERNPDRYRFDPNPRIRDGMTNIWRMLVKDSRSAVDQHFASILRELLKEMGGRLWRNREAASLALADLLQGRRWAEIKDHLEQIWSMAFRAIDDIKVCCCF